MLDNVEVLFCAAENGRNYFAYGDVPFGGFTVSEYLKYVRALETDKVGDDTIRALGVSPRKKLKKLCPAEMRIVTFLELTAGRTDRAVVVNLDGARYTRKNDAALRRLLGAVGDAYVCVTDMRFVSHAGKEVKQLAFGKPVDGIRPSFYAAKKLARKIGAKRISVM